jgi:hypothetical protein
MHDTHTHSLTLEGFDESCPLSKEQLTVLQRTLPFSLVLTFSDKREPKTIK